MSNIEVNGRIEVNMGASCPTGEYLNQAMGIWLKSLKGRVDVSDVMNGVLHLVVKSVFAFANPEHLEECKAEMLSKLKLALDSARMATRETLGEVLKEMEATKPKDAKLEITGGNFGPSPPLPSNLKADGFDLSNVLDFPGRTRH